jgi:hypothetical protein
MLEEAENHEVRRSWAWWFISVIPALGRLRKEDHQFEVSLCYIGRPCTKKQKQKNNKNIRRLIKAFESLRESQTLLKTEMIEQSLKYSA